MFDAIAQLKASLVNLTRQSTNAALDFLLPPLCYACDAPVLRNQALCATCWKHIHFIADPVCSCCGMPFDFAVEKDALCGACHASPPAFDQARSAVIYNDGSKPILLRFKHGDQTQALPALTEWLARAGETYWGQVDLIVPVPLHRWRLLKRRYNQSALLARALGKKLGIPVNVDLLTRIRKTPSQGHLTFKERHANVAGAFALKKKLKVNGQNIVLIDDVLTSGATVAECAKILKKEGAASVHVLTLARVRSHT